MQTAKRILLVEDNPGDALLLREALREIDSPPFELIHVIRLDDVPEELTRLGKPLPQWTKGLSPLLGVHPLIT